MTYRTPLLETLEQIESIPIDDDPYTLVQATLSLQQQYKKQQPIILKLQTPSLLDDEPCLCDSDIKRLLNKAKISNDDAKDFDIGGNAITEYCLTSASLLDEEKLKIERIKIDATYNQLLSLIPYHWEVV